MGCCAVGGGVAVTAARSLHGGESPWWIDLRRQGFTICSSSSVAQQPDRPRDDRHERGRACRRRTAELAGSSAARSRSRRSRYRDTGHRGVGHYGLALGLPSARTDLLRAAGAAIAQLHTIVLAPRPELPFRPRPIAVDDFASERRLGRMPTTELLRRADERVHAIPVPTRPTVFVHGDVWPGNTVLAGDTVRALIDWKTAGVGNPGVDLGELRKQVAIAYGEEAPKYVLDGWERAAGTSARDVPFWDATAALNTPTESKARATRPGETSFLAPRSPSSGTPNTIPNIEYAP